jgi:hypothetical protein
LRNFSCAHDHQPPCPAAAKDRRDQGRRIPPLRQRHCGAPGRGLRCPGRPAGPCPQRPGPVSGQVGWFRPGSPMASCRACTARRAWRAQGGHLICMMRHRELSSPLVIPHRQPFMVRPGCGTRLPDFPAHPERVVGPYCQPQPVSHHLRCASRAAVSSKKGGSHS